MKLLWQAVRAATVDTFSVVCIVWLILGVPTFGYRSVARTLASNRSLAALRELDNQEFTRSGSTVRGAAGLESLLRSALAPKARAERTRAAVWFTAPHGRLAQFSWLP